MLTLAINTASQESALALIQDDKILGETSWNSHANESTKVLPGLQKLLKDADKKWEDLTHIFVIEGPGAYTSLRVGITIANSLAWTLKIPMLAADVFKLWEHRLGEPDRVEPHCVAIAAGRERYQVKGDTTRYTLEELQEREVPLYGELPNRYALPFTFGEAVLEILPNAKKADQIEPLYVRPPDISVPKVAQQNL